MDIVRHIIQIIIFVDGTIEIVYPGNAAVACDIQFFLQIVAQRAVSQIGAVAVLEITLFADAVAEGVGHHNNPDKRIGFLKGFNGGAQGAGIGNDGMGVIRVVARSFLDIINAVVHNADNINAVHIEILKHFHGRDKIRVIAVISGRQNLLKVAGAKSLCQIR